MEHRNVAVATQVSKDDAQDSSGKKVEDGQAEEEKETEEEKRIRILKEEWKEENKVPNSNLRWKYLKAPDMWFWNLSLTYSGYFFFQKKTLKQYEEELALEKKKELLQKEKDSKYQKPEKRKVTVDKDFESMQLIGKNKEDGLFINQVGKTNLLSSISFVWWFVHFYDCMSSFFGILGHGERQA